VPGDLRNIYEILRHIFQFGYCFHGEFLVDLFGGDSSLEKVEGRAKALICFFGEVDQFVGGLSEMFGLHKRPPTLALVVSILS